MIRIFFIFIFTTCIRLSSSLEGYYQPPRGSSVWGYFTPPLLYRVPTRTHQTALDAMVDLTNNLGVTILKDHSYSKGNFAFSPYGVASVLVVLYEGACGESASQIHRAIGFPFDKDVIRVGFRSIHRHLRSYFSHEGYLSGISLNKEGSALKPEFKRILKFYGYDVDVNHPVDEDISLEDLASPATPSGGTIANSNVTSPSPNGVTGDDNQSMNNGNKTEGGDGNKEKPNDATTEAGDKTTDKPESATKDGSDSTEEEKENPDETGDDRDGGKVTENPEKTPEDDASTEGNKEKPDKTSEDVDSAESGTATPEKTTEDADESSETEKPTTTEKNQNDTQEMENSDKTSTESGGGAVEEDKGNSDMTTEDGSNSSVTETAETDDAADDKEGNKETDNSDKTSAQDGDTAEEDKQNPEDATNSSEEPNDTAGDQDDNKGKENEDKTPEDDNTSQEDKENSDSAIEELSQAHEKENEKVCAGKEDCESKTEDSTTTAKQEPEEMSITTLSDGLVLNKTVPTVGVEDLQVASSTIKNSDENSENSETGVPTTPETESEDSMSENLESPLTSTTDPPQQEEEVTKVTESGDTEKTTTTPNLDNGMLIPQPDDLPTDSESSTTEAEGINESTTPETPAESKTDATEDGSPAEVTTSKPHSRRKRNSLVEEKLLLSNRLRPLNKISVWGQMKLAGVESIRQARQAFHPKLSASRGMRKGRTITDYLKWPPASDVSLQLQNGMFDSHVSRNLELYKSLPRLLFLVDGAIDTPVPMMTYTHVFPYAYIPRLHTKALEFPLDDVRYKLLILLPVERRGLRQLIYDLTEFPLREVFTSLQPTRVRAMIPPFMVEGFVILTSSLQKLGIWDVFDPRKSNLSGMSIDPELYVRNVEQSVTVVIRNYVEILDIQTRTMAARNIEHEFEATHPFLYFVLDTATNVALMAGQILDPLNSRIY